MTRILRVFHLLTKSPKHGILSTLLFNSLLMGKEISKQNSSIPLRVDFWLSLNAASEF